MFERLRSHAADARVFVLLGDDIFLAARLDARQREFLSENLGKFLHGQFDFEDVPTRLIAGLRFAIVVLGSRERLAGLTGTDPDAAGVLLPVAKLRQIDLRKRDRHQVVPLLPDHLAPADVLGKVALHLPAHQLAEALQVLFDLLSHGESLGLVTIRLEECYQNAPPRVKRRGVR